MKKIFLLLVVIASAFSVSAQEKETIVLLTPSDFKTEIDIDNVQLIDVRTPEEFKEGHIKGAINIDFYSEEFESEFNKLDKEQPVYLYCRSGYRSNESAIKLSKMGFKEIYDLEGGFLNYNN
jgi:rhodanese-related sulfurtransferase